MLLKVDTEKIMDKTDSEMEKKSSPVHPSHPRSPPPPSSFLYPPPTSLLLPLLTSFFCLLVLSHGVGFYYLLTRLEGISVRLDTAEVHISESNVFLANEVTWLRSQLEDLTQVYGAITHSPHGYPQSSPHLDFRDNGHDRIVGSEGGSFGVHADDFRSSQMSTGDTMNTQRYPHSAHIPHSGHTTPQSNLKSPEADTKRDNKMKLLRKQHEDIVGDSKLSSQTHAIPPSPTHSHSFPQTSHTLQGPHGPPTHPQDPTREKRAATNPRGNGRGNGRTIQEDRQTQRAEGDRSWLQLTSYARIPYNAIKEFCSGTYDSCPPGPIGPPGPPGPRGNTGHLGVQGAKGQRGVQGAKGEHGPPGPPGVVGEKGSRGERGRRGFKGERGESGHDGSDGGPGEPGLDGIPGRNGLNGLPGSNGTDGINGLSGKNGTNGENGDKGATGDHGQKGSRGRRGITGPQGRKGDGGTPGTHGAPGISTWTVTGTDQSKLLIPPSIPGSTLKRPRNRRPIVIHEGDNLRLFCQATGVPPPLVLWSRLDGKAIKTGQWNDVQIDGPLLNLTLIDRSHMGIYVCQADNSVPPADEKHFPVEVHFEPYIRVHEWKVGTYNTSNAKLECHVESFPVALTYWLDQHGRMIDNSLKYTIEKIQHPDEVWKSTMQLTIHDIGGRDYGDYQCVARNEIDENKANIQVHEIDRNRHTPSTGTIEGITSGRVPPRFIGFEDLCPPVEECPDCPQCPESRGVLFGLRVEKFGNVTYPGYTNRNTDCMLSAVGKPVYHRHTNSMFGSWMQDASPKNEDDAIKYYSTIPTDTNHLFQFASKNSYRRNTDRSNYTLPRHFVGNSHVIYNGSFYYQVQGTSTIIRYDLNTQQSRTVTLPQLAMDAEEAYLYQETRDYVDLNIDDNGLWAIYSPKPYNTTVVSLMNPYTLMIEYSWHIHINHKNYGHFFIVCGVLYVIDSATERDTHIRLALDLYRSKRLEVDLQFTNPFRKSTMLAYNHHTKQILSWDNGNQLSYPVNYIDIGYNVQEEE